MQNKKFIVFSIVAIFLLQLIALWPSFSLTLYGDDWLSLWRATYHNGIHTPTVFNYLTYYLSPYGPQDLLVGFVNQVFGFWSLPYYIISFIFRFVIAILLLVIVLDITSSKLAAFLAGSFFAISVIGLDTTNWVFNMSTYVGLIFLVVFAYFYIKSRLINKPWFFLISLIFLFLAIVTVPIRMHGILVVIILTESWWMITKRKKFEVMLSLQRLISLFLIMVVIKLVGTSFADPNETLQRLNFGFSMIVEWIGQKHFDILVYPLTIFGNMIIPQNYWVNISSFAADLFGPTKPPFVQLAGITFVPWLVLNLLLLKVKANQDYKKYVIIFGFFGFILISLIWYFDELDKLNFSRSDIVGATIIGGLAMITTVGITILTRAKNKYLYFTYIVLVWPLAFMLMPWLFYPSTIYPAEHRYMIVSAIGISLIWAILSLLSLNKKIFISIFILSLLLQLNSTHNYLETLTKRRGFQISHKIWQSLEPKLPPFGDGSIKWVYFASDTTNGDIVYNNVFFGFPPRMALKYNISDTSKTPLTVTGYKETLSAVTDGQALIAQGHKPLPISPEQVYAYSITGDTPQTIQVTDITDKIRYKLKKDILQYQSGAKLSDLATQ